MLFPGTSNQSLKLFLAFIAVGLLAMLAIAVWVLDYPANLTIALISIFLLCAIILYLFFLFKAKPSDYVFARQIARSYLNRLGGLEQFRDLRLGRSTRIETTLDNSLICYDIKLLDKNNNSHGYMVVNLDENNSPLLEFSAEGLSLTEQLKEKVGDEDFRVLWLSPAFTVALNAEDKIVGSIGAYTPDEETVTEVKNNNKTQREILEIIIQQRKLYRAQFKKTIRKEWDFYSETGAKKKATEYAVEELPDDFNVYWEYFVEGYERAPRFRQIDPNTGANNKGHASGCGPTAWAMFIGHHDLLWTPELLRGSQRWNNSAWGSEDHENREEANDCYIDRVIMDLGGDDYLDVFGCILDNSGCNYNGDMEKGFDFIEDVLGHDTSSRRIWESHSTSVNKTLKYIQLYARPVILRIPWHYCVALSFVVNDDSDDIDEQWIQINTGWGSVKYLSSQYIERVWYVTNILPRTQKEHNLTSNHGPTFCTTETTLNSGLLDKLWMFWLSEDGKINYAFGTNGNEPDLANRKTIDITALYTPSVCTDQNYIYMAYVDENKKINLRMYDLKADNSSRPLEKSWQPLRFPDIESDVRPAITGGLYDWLTIAFSNSSDGVQKIASNKSLTDPSAWPAQLSLTVSSDNYWVPIYGGTWKTSHGLTLARYQNRTILSWHPRQSYYTPALIVHWISDHDGTHTIYTEEDHPLADYSHAVYDAPSLLVSNDTLFLTYKDSIGRIIIDYIYFLGLEASEEINPICNTIPYQCAYLTETSLGDPNVGFIQREGGKHPVLIAGWLNEQNKIVTRILSIDVSENPINYDGHP